MAAAAAAGSAGAQVTARCRCARLGAVPRVGPGPVGGPVGKCCVSSSTCLPAAGGCLSVYPPQVPMAANFGACGLYRLVPAGKVGMP